jgi:hypothetical protein
VTIQAKRASTGNITGALPGVPVNISVYPAEFSTGGLSVYSAKPSHQGNNSVEARSAQNGWLQLRYLYDPARAGDAQVASAPSSANNQTIQLKAGSRPVSVIVIAWEVVR